jgi:hypothetical protein
LNVNLIKNNTDLENLYKKIKKSGSKKIVLDTETTSLSIIEAQLV